MTRNEQTKFSSKEDAIAFAKEQEKKFDRSPKSLSAPDEIEKRLAEIDPVMGIQSESDKNMDKK